MWNIKNGWPIPHTVHHSCQYFWTCSISAGRSKGDCSLATGHPIPGYKNHNEERTFRKLVTHHQSLSGFWHFQKVTAGNPDNQHNKLNVPVMKTSVWYRWSPTTRLTHPKDLAIHERDNRSRVPRANAVRMYKIPAGEDTTKSIRVCFRVSWLNHNDMVDKSFLDNLCAKKLARLVVNTRLCMWAWMSHRKRKSERPSETDRVSQREVPVHNSECCPNSQAP